MREVEPQAVRRHKRAVLFDVRTEHFPQGRVHEMRGRVVAGRAEAEAGVHAGMHAVALPDAAADDDPLMEKQIRDRLRRLLDLDVAFRTAEHTLVADLTAAFGIERRAVQRDLDLVAFHRFFHTRVAFHDRLHRPVRVQFQIAEKLSRRDDAADVGIYGLGLGDFEPSALARALPLLFEGFLKSGLIQRQSLISRRIGCEVQGEAIGIVEFEQCLAGNDRLLRPLDVRDHLIEQTKSLVQGVEKPYLFSLRDMLDRRTMPFQLGIGALHPNNHGFRQAMEKRPVEAETERPPIAHGSAQNAAEDVASALIAGQYPVRHQEGNGAAVVSQHPERVVGLVSFAIASPD